MNAPLFPFFAILFAVISVQFGAANAKQLFPEAGAIGITLLRLSLASLILMAFWRPFRKRLSLVQFKAVALYGASLGFMNLLFYLSIERIPLGLAVAIEFVGPLTVAIFGSRKKTDFLWAFLAAAGIVLISPLNSASNLDLIGVLYALIAAIFWAFYVICGKRASELMEEGCVVTWGMVIAAISVFPFWIITNSQANLSVKILPQALLVALFSSAIPFSLEMLALKRISKLSFGILLSMEPAMGGIMGLLLLNERLDPTQIVAISLIVIASVGTTFGPVTRSKKEHLLPSAEHQG